VTTGKSGPRKAFGKGVKRVMENKLRYYRSWTTMLRAYSKYLWIVGVVALLLTVGASTSEAFWPHHHGCRCATCCLDVVAPCCPPVIPAYSVAYSP